MRLLTHNYLQSNVKGYVVVGAVLQVRQTKLEALDLPQKKLVVLLALTTTNNHGSSSPPLLLPSSSHNNNGPQQYTTSLTFAQNHKGLSTRH